MVAQKKAVGPVVVFLAPEIPDIHRHCVLKIIKKGIIGLPLIQPDAVGAQPFVRVFPLHQVPAQLGLAHPAVSHQDQFHVVTGRG